MKINTYEDLVQAEVVVKMIGQKIRVSVFKIDGILIDTGPSKRKDMLIPLFADWEMDQVVLTHHHEDHTGLASWLQNNKDIPIYMHEIGVEKCREKVRLPLYRHMFWGGRKPFIAKPISNTFESEKYRWKVLHTPGHAGDHIALYNREKGMIIGGDLYVQSRPKNFYSFESTPVQIQSLRKVLTNDFETYVCSHAGIILKGRKAIHNKLDYLISMQQEVLFLYNKGLSPKEIQQKMFPKKHIMNYISFFENSPKHMINSVINI